MTETTPATSVTCRNCGEELDEADILLGFDCLVCRSTGRKE